MNEEQKIVPFFPLSVFLLPGEDIPLRIFEPRYIQLIEEARDEDFNFVIPYVLDNEIQDIGCEVKLKQVLAESPRGRMVITVEAVDVVIVHSMTEQMTGKLYAGGAVTCLSDPGYIRDPELLARLNHYHENFDKEFLSDRLESDTPPGYYELVAALNLPSEEKFRFINLPSREAREHYLNNQIQYLMLIRNQELLLDNDFGLN